MALQALNSLTLQVAKEHPRLQNYFAFLKTVYFLGLQTVPCVGKKHSISYFRMKLMLQKLCQLLLLNAICWKEFPG